MLSTLLELAKATLIALPLSLPLIMIIKSAFKEQDTIDPTMARLMERMAAIREENNRG
jgi:hypothetical protein